MQYQQHHSGDVYGAVSSREKGIGNRGYTGEAAAALLILVVPFLVWAGEGLAPPLPRLDPDLGVPIGEPLLSAATAAPPVMDGLVETTWETAPPLSALLHYGLHGDEPAGMVELRSLHDDERVYFLARWSAATPGGELGTWRNLLTVHWRLVEPGAVSGAVTGSEGLACTVGCHTATADGEGGLVGVRAETIPPGLEEDLPAGGGWSAGTWTLEWSRPRVSDNPYDQNLVDPAQSYRFFVKLFLGLQNQPDPTSDVHELRLGR
jgi:hypothetical protein